MHMRRLFSFSLLWVLAVLCASAGTIGDIRRALEQSSVSQVQEKVYVHTDNQCYFVGDTLWYKAYVVRADNLQPTDMSRILYVELLSPDGLLVERQQIVIGQQAFTCGQFCLRDSLYSGYYELRAYTRWMLNFNVTEHRYAEHDTWLFFNKQMAADYYRQWDGLYSRVLPVYSKPAEPGDYDARRMYQRPKTRLQEPKKDRLSVTFFPEGGHLIDGISCRVAFDVRDQNGEAVSLTGNVAAGGQQLAQARSDKWGRGVFTLTPNGRQAKAAFVWRGKKYEFALPAAEARGAAIRLDGGQLSVWMRQLPADHQYGLSILCRGALKFFQELPLQPEQTVSLPIDSLPTGVCDVTLFDSDGRILADRLFFVDHRDHQPTIACTEADLQRHTYQPYERVTLNFQLPAPKTVFSLAVRDTQTDEPTYDDGNLMTDLLLSSELRGFIAHPAYYFEKDDEEHRRQLDLLMMVQGWRKYKWQELSDTARTLRYEPEKSFTVSGAVYKMLGISGVEPEEISAWQNGLGKTGTKLTIDDDASETTDGDGEGSGFYSTDQIMIGDDADDGSLIEYGLVTNANDELGVNHGGLKREVLVEAEVVMDDGIVAAVQKTTNGGRFTFQIPPFYGATFLNMKGYKEKDSLTKAMTARGDRDMFNETAYADYYVKRDMPFPVYTQEYSYYQKHAPEWEVTIDEDSLSDLSMENDVHQLQNVNVKGHRRGRRAVDWTKPAFVRDAYDLYNDLTDYGLSFGYYDMRRFPLQVATFLFGNMGRYRHFNVDGRLEHYTYWRNYSPVSSHATEAERSMVYKANRTPQYIYSNIKLARLQDLRVFTDFEPRTEDSTMVENLYTADATIEMVPIADDGKQVVFRDRHIYLHGFNEPVAFYQPDYSVGLPPAPTDYRRTLYWNPNAVADGEGRFSATFYNNAKQTRIKISAAGVSPDGRLLYSK